MLVHMLGTRLKFSPEEPLKNLPEVKKAVLVCFKAPRLSVRLREETNNTIGLLFIPLEAFQR